MICELAASSGRAPSEFYKWPSSDLTTMAAFREQEPFGVVRDDYHHSRTAALIANCFSTLLYALGRSGQRKTYSPSDFMFKAKPKTTEQEKLSKLSAGLSALAKRRVKQ